MVEIRRREVREDRLAHFGSYRSRKVDLYWMKVKMCNTNLHTTYNVG
jgi:hypothetical protein